MDVFSIRLVPLPIQRLAFGSISGSFSPIGSPLAEAVRIILIQNLTDVLVTFSFDGTNEHLDLPSNGFLLIDATANKTHTQGFYVAQGTQIYAQTSGSPSTGSVNVSGFYGFSNN